MIRLVAVVVFIMVAGAWALHVNPWVIGVPAVILFGLAYTKGGLRTRCPECGSAIKIGYSRCRTCGWSSKPNTT